MNEIERDIERIKIECEIKRIEDERRISRLATERYLATLKANESILKNDAFECVLLVMLAWVLVLLTITTIIQLCGK